ncbi:MAG: VWA domain-containing protein [Fibrobacteraceae bacterium]|nr:VWA domain-containing protein [Fibrobacteraceae bacterium]
MEEKRADVVFVIDASDSMKPCFQQLKNSIRNFVHPFKEEGFESLRLGLLAYNAGPNNGKWVYRNTFINGDAPENMNILYGQDEEAKEALFTRSGDGFVDVDTFCTQLDKIQCCADENTPLALDCAGDFPFEPLCSTRRIIVVFTDEKMEDGVLKNEPIGDDCCELEKVMKKITNRRRATLYYFGPQCEATDMMQDYPRVHVTEVKEYKQREDGEDIWANIDFEKILATMGKNISTSVCEVVDEGEYQRAVYGQDGWDLETWGKDISGGVIDITHVTEGAVLDVSEPLQWLNAKMLWKTPIDLDIHAFYKRTNGYANHIFYQKKKDGYMELDHDAGVGDKLDSPAGNEENIRCRTLNGIERILIATKIFPQHGCFSDYKGCVQITTSNPRQPMINVNMESRKRLDWCVIAMIDNRNPEKPRVFAINQVIAYAPDVDDPRWLNYGNN